MTRFIWHAFIGGIAVLIALEGPGFAQTSNHSKEDGNFFVESFSVPTRSAPSAVAWARDGQTLAAASDWGQRFTIYNAIGYPTSEISSVGSGPYLQDSLAFANNGQSLITYVAPNLPEDTAFTVWNVRSGKQALSVQGALPGRSRFCNRALTFVISEDGSLLAIAPDRPGKNSVYIYDTSRWSLALEVPLPTGIDGVFALAFSPDNKTIAIGTIHGEIVLVSVNNAREQRVISTAGGPSAGVGKLAFSHDGRFLAAGRSLSISGEFLAPAIEIFAMANGDVRASSQVGNMPIRGLSWTPGDHTIIFIGQDGHPKTWDINTSTVENLSPGKSQRAYTMAATIDGSKLAIAYPMGIAVFSFEGMSQ